MIQWHNNKRIPLNMPNTTILLNWIPSVQFSLTQPFPLIEVKTQNLTICLFLHSISSIMEHLNLFKQKMPNSTNLSSWSSRLWISWKRISSTKSFILSFDNVEQSHNLNIILHVSNIQIQTTVDAQFNQNQNNTDTKWTNKKCIHYSKFK